VNVTKIKVLSVGRGAKMVELIPLMLLLLSVTLLLQNFHP
jgi:hypothetical protein